ncbi:MAG TPA: hypothetical protein VGY58_11995, partial [Gemmataceae bacterium]|nr:hypothetical protein [Gemmataceae bacterium]
NGQTLRDMQSASAIQADGLHNVYRITDRLYSGSSPEGDEGFRSLQNLGIKTIISVDGAKPEVGRAHKFGMRYVHLPIGYDGMTQEQALHIAKAARDLPGPVYIHCHHGKHRGPAAAAIVHLCLDDKCTVETVLAEMRRAGTDPHYTGLYAAPQTLRRPSAQEWEKVSSEFPEVAAVPDLAQLMVAVDEHWDHLKQIKTSGWKAPPQHPDIDPPHEALQLAEQYREASRLPGVRQRTAEFRDWLRQAELAALELEGALRTGASAEADRARAERAFAGMASSCSRCHAKYRDVPRQ